MEKFTTIQIAAITGVNIYLVREQLRTYLHCDRLPRNSSFNEKEINEALKLELPSQGFGFKLECAKTILYSQERSKILFDNPFGIRNLEFPPSLKVYEILLSKSDLIRIKESWKRKHLHLHTNLNPTIK